MNHTMAKQNSKSVSIAGMSDKCSIIGTFTTTLNNHFLPMQLIYGGGKGGTKHFRAKNFIFALREIKFAPNILQIR